jgi:hypothetical protein
MRRATIDFHFLHLASVLLTTSVNRSYLGSGSSDRPPNKEQQHGFDVKRTDAGADYREMYS